MLYNTKIDHTLSHKTNFKHLKGLTECMFSDHNGIKISENPQAFGN